MEQQVEKDAATLNIFHCILSKRISYQHINMYHCNI